MDKSSFCNRMFPRVLSLLSLDNSILAFPIVSCTITQNGELGKHGKAGKKLSQNLFLDTLILLIDL